MRAGDKIRIEHRPYGYTTDHTIEEFRWCLGIFLNEDHRRAGRFTPLCDLYEPGPESEQDYISNYGEYYTNQVPSWMDLPRDDDAEAAE